MSDNIWTEKELEIFQIPTPPSTTTYGAVPYKLFIELIHETLDKANLPIIEKNYSLGHKGQQVFGTYVLDMGDDNDKMMVGFRTSHDRSLAHGICSGRNCLVCSNLMFEGTYVEYRKHTAKVGIGAIQAWLEESMPLIRNRMERYWEWCDGLKNFELTNYDSFNLLLQCRKEELLGVKDVGKVMDTYYLGEGVQYYPPTLGGFQGACTEVFRDGSLQLQEHKNRSLNEILETAVIDLESDGYINPV